MIPILHDIMLHLTEQTSRRLYDIYVPDMSICMYVFMYTQHIQQSMDQPGKVANPAININRGQLDEHGNKRIFSPFLCAPENLVTRNGFGHPVPCQPAHSPHSG